MIRKVWSFSDWVVGFLTLTRTEGYLLLVPPQVHLAISPRPEYYKTPSPLCWPTFYSFQLGLCRKVEHATNGRTQLVLFELIQIRGMSRSEQMSHIWPLGEAKCIYK